MKISLIQLDSSDNKESNFKKAQAYIIKSAANGSDVVCLSESFLYRGGAGVQEAEAITSDYIVAFQELAKTKNINLVLGSISLKSEIPNKITNTCLIIDRKGNIIHHYNKIYMYDVEREDLVFHESDNTIPGIDIGFFELDGVKMGVGICVDLRYPEYFRELAKRGAEVIFLPSNFRKLTGEIAWDILTKARAIENQVYFCACGQTGQTGPKERCGNSRIISFDGRILSDIGGEEGVVVADLDIESMYKFRKEFPVLNQIKVS